MGKLKRLKKMFQLFFNEKQNNTIYYIFSVDIIMSQEEKDLDVNKAFEDLLFAEEIAQKSGYEKGYESGKTQLLKGYHLGYHRGSVIAAQLGYYSGVLDHYLQSNVNNTCERTVAIAKQLLAEIRGVFPEHQDDNLDILQAVENIKVKYAKFCSLAKIYPRSYPEAEKLEF